MSYVKTQTVKEKPQLASDWIGENHPENGEFKAYFTEEGLYNAKEGFTGEVSSEDLGYGLRWEWTYKDGKKDGITKGYWANGNFKQTRTFVDGKLNGPQIYYYETGNIRKIKNYKDDVLHGETSHHYESEEVWLRGKWKDGNKCGKWSYYYENGDIRKEEKYRKGKPVGSELWYWPGGILNHITKYKYFNGKRRLAADLWYFKNGKLEKELFFKGGRPIGRPTYYMENKYL